MLVYRGAQYEHGNLTEETEESIMHEFFIAIYISTKPFQPLQDAMSIVVAAPHNSKMRFCKYLSP